MTRSVVGLIPALLLGLALVLASCQDQPLDSGKNGTVRLDTTIVRSVDTIIVNGTDTVVVTRVDTTFVTVRDTVRTEVVKRDTIRDTVVKVRIDTVEVPGGENRLRVARLTVNGVDRSSGSTGRIDSFTIDVTEWFNYRFIDSAGEVSGLGLAMSLGLPPRFREIDIAFGRSAEMVTLEGIALFIPLFRPVELMNNAGAIELDNHPYEFRAGDRPGGIMISYRKGDDGIENAWTGNVFEVSTRPNPGQYRSRGTLRIKGVDRNRRVIAGTIGATIYVPEEQNGMLSVLPVALRIDFELGW